MHKKQILYIIPNKFWGGGQQYIYELSKEIRKKEKADLHYVGRNFTLIIDKFSELGTFKALPLKSILDLYSILSISYILLTKRIDIIHAHMPKDAIMAIIAKKLVFSKAKVIMTRHLVRKGKFNIIYRWAYRHIYKYIFVSKTAEEDFFSNCTKNIKINNCVIHNAIKGTREDSSYINLRQDCNIGEDHIIIGFVGRITQDKGIIPLFEAFNNISSDKVILVCAGTRNKDFEEELENHLKENSSKSRIYFYPYVENIYNFIQQLDLIIIPSIVKEACPLIILEAMSIGKTAIITTNNGAQKEIVKDKEEALLVPPNDADSLRNAIELLINDDTLRKKLSSNALKKSKQFSYDIFLNKMFDIYSI